MNEVLMRDKVMRVLKDSGLGKIPVTLSYSNIARMIGSDKRYTVRDAIGTLVRRGYLNTHKGNTYQTLTTTYTRGDKYDKYIVTSDELEIQKSVRMTNYWKAVHTANSPEGAARALSIVNKNIDRVGTTLDTLKERRNELATRLSLLKSNK